MPGRIKITFMGFTSREELYSYRKNSAGRTTPNGLEKAASMEHDNAITVNKKLCLLFAGFNEKK